MSGRAGVPPRRGYFFGLSLGGFSPGPLVGAGSVPFRSRVNEPGGVAIERRGDRVAAGRQRCGIELRGPAATAEVQRHHERAAAAARTDRRSDRVAGRPLDAVDQEPQLQRDRPALVRGQRPVRDWLAPLDRVDVVGRCVERHRDPERRGGAVAGAVAGRAVDRRRADREGPAQRPAST